MKKLFSILVCFLLVVTTVFLPVSAQAAENEQIIISQTVEFISEDCYFVETIYVPSTQTYSNTKTGTKVAECISSGTSIFTISVTGTFTYNGTSAQATSASGSISALVSGVTLNSRRAYTSGASACAFGSVNYNGVTLQKTVTLTCDKNGNLS